MAAGGTMTRKSSASGKTQKNNAVSGSMGKNPAQPKATNAANAANAANAKVARSAGSGSAATAEQSPKSANSVAWSATILSGSAEQAARSLSDRAEICKQLGDSTRLQICAMLAASPTGRMNVTEICANLPNSSQPAASHHLALLRTGRILRNERDGKNNNYYLNPECFELIRRFITA